MMKNLNPLILRYNAMQCSPFTLSRLSDLWKAVDGSTPSLIDAAAYVNTEALWNMYSETLNVLEHFQQQFAEKKYPQILKNDYAHWIKSFDERHSTTIATVAEAIYEARTMAITKSPGVDNIFQLQLSQIEKVSESLLRTHLSVSLVMQQMVNIIQRRPNLVGPVSLLKCVEQQVIAVESLAEHAGLSGTRFEICCPGEVQMIGVEPIIEQPIHEVLKNAVFATLKHHQSKQTREDPPPIKITLHDSHDYAYVGVEDEGMGMRPDQVRNCFRIMWSSAAKRYNRLDEQQSYQPVGDPLRGLGMGLTMSRLCTQHHGGDTQLVSIKGKGTHVVLCFSKNADAPERIPHTSHGDFSMLMS